MAEIINLNRARKAKAKTQKSSQAAQNRLFFGRTKGEKRQQEKQVDQIERHLDGARRDTPPKQE